MNTYGVVSPTDLRDLIAYASSADCVDADVLPSVLDLRRNLQPIADQGTQGTCVAQAAACMKEWQEFKDIGLLVRMSAQFIYNLRVNQEQSGMYCRNLMQIMAQYGTCTEEQFPYRTMTPPSSLDKAKARLYRISGYARIDTLDGLKSALYSNGPCLIGFDVYDTRVTEFWKPTSDGQKASGGHVMSVVGYNQKGFLLRNSWGTQWGNAGYCEYPYVDWGGHRELWTTIDADTKKLLKAAHTEETVEDRQARKDVTEVIERGDRDALPIIEPDASDEKVAPVPNDDSDISSRPVWFRILLKMFKCVVNPLPSRPQQDSLRVGETVSGSDTRHIEPLDT